MLRSSLCSIGGAFLPRLLPRLHVVWLWTPVAVGSTDVSSCPRCLVCDADECVYVHGSIIRLHGWNHHDVMVGRSGAVSTSMVSPHPDPTNPPPLENQPRRHTMEGGGVYVDMTWMPFPPFPHRTQDGCAPQTGKRKTLRKHGVEREGEERRRERTVETGETNRDHRSNETTRFKGEIRTRIGTRPHGESTYQCGRKRKQGRNSSFRCVGSVCRRLKRGKMRMETPLQNFYRFERPTS